MEIELLIANRGARDEPNVALTFDDGPSPYSTPEILDILHSNSCRASFFMIGRWAKDYPKLVRTIASNGHAIGGHSFTHGGDDGSKQFGNLRLGNQIIEDIIGKPLKYMRVPNFAYNALERDGSLRVKELLEQDFQIKVHSRDITVVGCDVDPADWAYNISAVEIIQRVLSGTQNGSIIDLHDGSQKKYQHADRATRTIEALPTIITRLKERKFNLVSLDEMCLEYENKRFQIA